LGAEASVAHWHPVTSPIQTATATLHTNRGDIKIALFGNHAPKTVANFVGLAQGTKDYSTENASGGSSGPFYDGAVFHRVIDGFMIQGGDPTGTGTGGPGYTFDDECPPGGPSFDRVGLLAMANAGPGTNGCQFFVTVAPAEWLTGRHTIFGEVTEGYEVVERISKSSTGAQDRPSDDIVIERIDIG
jgi:peptidyl-prolyl cis-trans isomerase A (cyclophilin A)